MSKIIVRNSNSLEGKVVVSGSKNAALPILAATILSDGKNIITQAPKLSDISNMCGLLESIGAHIDVSEDTIKVNYSKISNNDLSYELVSKMRASFLLAGPLLARCKHARISLPGGCPIGTRPIDLHLKGFAMLGADITQGHGYIDIHADKLRGAKIYLDFPSVGATENLLMASCLAEGETIIENVAAEPEIVDLAEFLNKLGANISGMGSDTIKIQGVKSLGQTKHNIIPDRIEAGTFMVAAVMTGGDVRIENIVPSHIKSIVAKLREMGAQIREGENYVVVSCGDKLVTKDIKTMPYPGFPTDMQAQFSACMSIMEGTGIIIETVFENRFLHVAELNRMGANIKIDGRCEIVEGKQILTGAQVQAPDLRAGASLVLAGLVAKGETTISGVEHIDRGYDNLVGKLQSIGANIERV